MADTEEQVVVETVAPRPLIYVFGATVTIFFLLIAYIFLQDAIPDGNRLFAYIFFPGIAILTALGIVLAIMARLSPVRRSLRIALILTGVSAVGMPASALLHNVVYGVMSTLFGPEFWSSLSGADEGLFFTLALIVFPLLLLVSAVSAVVIMHNTKGRLSA